MLNCPLCNCPIVITLYGAPVRVVPTVGQSTDAPFKWTLTFDTPQPQWTPEEEAAFNEHRTRLY
jgi:hypothetical protein